MTAKRQDSLLARAMSWTDLARLSELERMLFAEDAWSEQIWWAELALRPRRDYLVLTDGEDLVGYAGLDLGGAVADVMTITVAPAARSRGLGAALLEILESRAREAGAAYLMLEVRDDNQPAKSLYERAGFDVLRVRRRYYQPGDVDALQLRKTLRAAAAGGDRD